MMNGVKFDADYIIEQAKAGHTVYLVRKAADYLIATRIEEKNGMPYAADELSMDYDNEQYFDAWGDLRGFIAAENDQVAIDKCHTLTTTDEKTYAAAIEWAAA